MSASGSPTKPTTRRGPIHASLVARSAIAALTAVTLFLLLRLGLIEFFAWWNRWQFAIRPELENWTMPRYGVEVPATVWALGVVILAAVLAITMYILGRRHAQ